MDSLVAASLLPATHALLITSLLDVLLPVPQLQQLVVSTPAPTSQLQRGEPKLWHIMPLLLLFCGGQHGISSHSYLALPGVQNPQDLSEGEKVSGDTWGEGAAPCFLIHFPSLSCGASQGGLVWGSAQAWGKELRAPFSRLLSPISKEQHSLDLPFQNPRFVHGNCYLLILVNQVFTFSAIN